MTFLLFQQQLSMSRNTSSRQLLFEIMKYFNDIIAGQNSARRAAWSAYLQTALNGTGQQP
jgi:hypothetical protein